MQVSDNALFLGVKVKGGGKTKDGTEYSGYTAIHFICEKELKSRAYYLGEKDPLLAKIDNIATMPWGTPVLIVGTCDENNRLILTDVINDGGGDHGI